MEIKRHSIWNEDETLESFKEKVLKDIYVKPNVHHDIKEFIKIIERLLLHSYYEYEFIDVAFTQAILTLEKAIKLKYKEAGNIVTNKTTLTPLINWAFKNYYFETWNKGVLEQLRDIRNGKVHDSRKASGGLMFLSKLHHTLSLINDLYEDPALRIERKIKITQLENEFNLFLSDGGILSLNEKRWVVFKASVVFLNNKLSTEDLSLAIWPIIDPQPYRDGKHLIPHYHYIHLKNYRFEGDIFKGIDLQTDKEVTLTQAIDEVNKAKYNGWKQDFYALPDSKSILWRTTPENDHFYECVRRFHQIA